MLTLRLRTNTWQYNDKRSFQRLLTPHICSCIKLSMPFQTCSICICHNRQTCMDTFSELFTTLCNGGVGCPEDFPFLTNLFPTPVSWTLLVADAELHGPIQNLSDMLKVWVQIGANAMRYFSSCAIASPAPSFARSLPSWSVWAHSCSLLSRWMVITCGRSDAGATFSTKHATLIGMICSTLLGFHFLWLPTFNCRSSFPCTIKFCMVKHDSTALVVFCHVLTQCCLCAIAFIQPCWVKHERHFTNLFKERHVGCNHYIPIMIWMVVGCPEAEGEVRPSFFLSSWQRQHLLQSVFFLPVIALATRSSWQRSRGNPFTTVVQYASGCVGYNYVRSPYTSPHHSSSAI